MQAVERAVFAPGAFVGHEGIDMGTATSICSPRLKQRGCSAMVSSPSTMRTRSSEARISSGRPT